jgi:hypothetical protein
MNFLNSDHTRVDVSVRLYLQLFIRGLMSYLRYLCLFAYSDVQHNVFLFCLSLYCVPKCCMLHTQVSCKLWRIIKWQWIFLILIGLEGSLLPLTELHVHRAILRVRLKLILRVKDTYKMCHIIKQLMTQFDGYQDLLTQEYLFLLPLK